MKIGTDGVLLGSWTPVRDAKRIVDIGTGCGLIALMIGQRTVASEAFISAIDIDVDAARQALENFSASPWPDRLPSQLSQTNVSLRDFARQSDSEARFDLAVCNPPYFSNDYLPSGDARTVARHTSQLSRQSLFLHSFSILKPTGRFCLVLPYDQTDETIEIACEAGFRLLARTDVRPNPQAELKRVLLEFGKQPMDRGDRIGQNPTRSELVIETKRNEFTPEYKALTQELPFKIRRMN